MSPSYSHHPGTERPKITSAPKGDAHFNRPHMHETTMAELIIAFWRAKGYPLIVAYADKGVIRSNLGRNVYPPKE